MSGPCTSQSFQRPWRIAFVTIAVGCSATWGGKFGEMEHPDLCTEVAAALAEENGDPHMPVSGGRSMSVRRSYSIYCEGHVMRACTELEQDACVDTPRCKPQFSGNEPCPARGTACAEEPIEFEGCQPATPADQRLPLVHWLHCRSGQKGPPPCYPNR